MRSIAMRSGAPAPPLPFSATSARSLKLRSSVISHLLLEPFLDLGENSADFPAGLLSRAALKTPHRNSFRYSFGIAVASHNLAREDILAGFAQQLLQMGSLTRRFGVEVRWQQAEEGHALAAVTLLHPDHGLQQAFDALHRIVLKIDGCQHVRGRNQTCHAAKSNRRRCVDDANVEQFGSSNKILLKGQHCCGAAAINVGQRAVCWRQRDATVPAGA